MPGVQCVICLSCDTASEDWCVLRECGHVFHLHCVMQSLEHSHRCPQCRKEYSKRRYNASNPPYQRLFLEFSDEAASQPTGSPSGGGGASGGADPAQLAFLQGQLRDRERRIQALSTQVAEAEERGAKLERELALARSGLHDKEARLQEKIAELAREHKQVKGLANQVANLTAQLRGESARASLLALASDHSLAGSALGAEVDKLVRLGLKAPNDFWEKLMSERSQVIMANSNKWAREKAALERQQAELQAEVTKLQAEAAGLRRSLAAAAQQQPGGAAAAAALDPPPEQQQQQRAPRPGRHAIRRFGAVGPGAAAAAAAEEEDPLLQSYDVLDSVRLGDLPGQRRHLAPQQQAAAAAQQQAPPPAAAAAAEEEEEGEEEEGIVLLDDTEDQCFSEVESEEEEAQEGAVRQQTAAPPPPAQQQQQQQQQARPSGGASLLGKRSAATDPAPDENCASGSGRAPLLPLAAGPGRLAMQRGPGKTFIRNTAAASIGIDRGKYISSGPDGKGGVATTYRSGGGGKMRMAQKQIDLPALHQAGDGKKARGGSSSAEMAATQALRRNNALPITSFFSKAPAKQQQ